MTAWADTRHSSARQPSQSAACISTRRQMTTSNARSGNSSRCASPTANRIASDASAACTRAIASISSDGSTRGDAPPARAMRIAARPVPVPTSRIVRSRIGLAKRAITSACDDATSWPIGPPKRRCVEVPGGRWVRVVAVAVVIARRCAAHATSLRTRAAAADSASDRNGREEHRQRLPRPLEICLVAVFRLGQFARLAADERRPRRVLQRRHDSFAERSRLGLGQNRGVVAQDLRMGQQSRRDDRLSRAQVLVDLQRRVGAPRPGRHEHVATPADTPESRSMAARPRRWSHRRFQRRAPDSWLSPPDRACHRPSTAARSGIRDAHVRHRGEQQVQSLVCLERPGVQDDRRVRARIRSDDGPRRLPPPSPRLL